MSKKKKKWWQKETWTPIEQKAVNDYNKGITSGAGYKRPKDEDGFYTDEGGYDSSDNYYANGGQGAFDWGWDRKLMNNEGQGAGKKNWESSRNEFNTGYNQTGAWRGYEYYKAPQLSYKYVQQMANALASQHKITVRVGSEWKVDLIEKELTYNPASLIYGTKSELLATLMHEIGKLRYMEHPSKLTNKYLKMYNTPAIEVLATFEDVRVDYMMLKAYESASEIYESSIPAIEKQVALYVENAKNFRKLFIDVVKKQYSDIVDPYIKNNDMGSQDLADKLLTTFGSSKPVDVEQKLADMAKHMRENGNVLEYCAEMMQVMYDLDTNQVPVYPNIKKKVELTVDAIEPSKKKQTSQELVDYLDTAVYPHIEDLLKDFSEKSETLDKFFPKMVEKLKSQIMKLIKDAIKSGALGEGVAMDKKGNIKTRSSGQTKFNMPPEWANGDYRVLKDSVISEIKELINKLTFIRREELVVKYQGDQKRGKLNTRKLYKSALGSRRLFKKKLVNIDTVQSFAFSVLIDISGSMHGSRIVHSTRALIIFAEVFKRLGIPFELVAFGDGARVIKSFEKEIDKTIEKQIGGLVKADGGGTNLHNGLDALKLKDRPEANKVVIVLSDGGVGNIGWFDQNYFIPWSKKNIKSVGFGIECESQMANLCMGNSKVLSDASMLPMEFTQLLKSLIRRK